MRKMLALRFLPSNSRVRSLCLAGSLYSTRAIDHLGVRGFSDLFTAGSCTAAGSRSTVETGPSRVRTCAEAVRLAPKNSPSRAQTGCERAKLPPHCWSILGLSIFAEWGLKEANTRRGVFRVKTN